MPLLAYDKWLVYFYKKECRKSFEDVKKHRQSHKKRTKITFFKIKLIFTFHHE